MIQHHVEAKTIYLIHCSTNDKISYIFTKGLGRDKVEKLIKLLGLTNASSYKGGEC
jgi:hypothetical protein